MSSRPVLLLVPGAFHLTTAFGKITPKLEAQGYKCVPLSLPSVGGTSTEENLDKDIAVVREAVIKECDAGNDVVVCSHSWSGIVVGSALEGLGKAERAQSGKKGVLKIVFIASFVAPIGLSLFDAIERKIPSWWRIEGPHLYPQTPVHLFYNDLEAEEADYWASQIQPQNLASQSAPATAAAYFQIPSVYLMCEYDNAVPLPAQEAMVKAAQDNGADMEVERILSSHSPFLSHPDFVVDFLKRAAGDESGASQK